MSGTTSPHLTALARQWLKDDPALAHDLYVWQHGRIVLLSTVAQ